MRSFTTREDFIAYLDTLDSAYDIDSSAEGVAYSSNDAATLAALIAKLPSKSTTTAITTTTTSQTTNPDPLPVVVDIPPMQCLTPEQISAIAVKHLKTQIPAIVQETTNDEKWLANSDGTNYNLQKWFSRLNYNIVLTEQDEFGNEYALATNGMTNDVYFNVEDTWIPYTGLFKKYVIPSDDTYGIKVNLLYPEMIKGSFGGLQDIGTVYNNDLIWLDDGAVLVPNQPTEVSPEGIWAGPAYDMQSLRIAPWIAGCFRRIRITYICDAPEGEVWACFIEPSRGPDHIEGYITTLPDGSKQYDGLLREEISPATIEPISGNSVYYVNDRAMVDITYFEPAIGNVTVAGYANIITNILHDAHDGGFHNSKYDLNYVNENYDDGMNKPAYVDLPNLAPWLYQCGEAYLANFYLSARPELFVAIKGPYLPEELYPNEPFYPIVDIDPIDPPWTHSLDGIQGCYAPNCLKLYLKNMQNYPLVITKIELYEPYVSYASMLGMVPD